MKLTRLAYPEATLTILVILVGFFLTGTGQGASPPAGPGSGSPLVIGYGGNTPEPSVVFGSQGDTLTDSMEVEVQLQGEIQRIQQAIQEARQELQRTQRDSMLRRHVDMEELNRNLDQAMRELERLQESGELQKLEKMNIEMRLPEFSNRPFLGLVVDDLNFRKAYEMHYNENYGVLVTSVVPNSSADDAGLAQGDIIMEFDGQKVWYARMLKNYLDAKKIGDKVGLTIFRNGQEQTVSMTLRARRMTLPEPPPTSSLEDTTEATAMTPEAPEEPDWGGGQWGDVDWDNQDFLPSNDFLANGYGGGGWIPMWFNLDMTEMNKLVTSLGFNALPRNGILMQGGGGKGPIGNGWFIGGMGAGFGVDRNITISDQGGTGQNLFRRRIHYGTAFGGVTLDKRFRLSKNLVTSAGFLLGGGGTTLEISQSDGVLDWSTIGTDFGRRKNSYLKIHKSYFIVQPKVMFMVRITPWLAIRSEAGYMLGYSFKKGWEAKVADETFEMTNAPQNNGLTGLTFSIGPWFGF